MGKTVNSFNHFILIQITHLLTVLLNTSLAIGVTTFVFNQNEGEKLTQFLHSISYYTPNNRGRVRAFMSQPAILNAFVDALNEQRLSKTDFFRAISEIDERRQNFPTKFLPLKAGKFRLGRSSVEDAFQHIFQSFVEAKEVNETEEDAGHCFGNQYRHLTLTRYVHPKRNRAIKILGLNKHLSANHFRKKETKTAIEKPFPAINCARKVVVAIRAIAFLLLEDEFSMKSSKLSISAIFRFLSLFKAQQWTDIRVPINACIDLIKPEKLPKCFTNQFPAAEEIIGEQLIKKEKILSRLKRLHHVLQLEIIKKNDSEGAQNNAFTIFDSFFGFSDIEFDAVFETINECYHPAVTNPHLLDKLFVFVQAFGAHCSNGTSNSPPCQLHALLQSFKALKRLAAISYLDGHFDEGTVLFMLMQLPVRIVNKRLVPLIDATRPTGNLLAKILRLASRNTEFSEHIRSGQRVSSSLSNGRTKESIKKAVRWAKQFPKRLHVSTTFKMKTLHARVHKSEDLLEHSMEFSKDELFMNSSTYLSDEQAESRAMSDCMLTAAQQKTFWRAILALSLLRRITKKLSAIFGQKDSENGNEPHDQREKLLTALILLSENLDKAELHSPKNIYDVNRFRQILQSQQRTERIDRVLNALENSGAVSVTPPLINSVLDSIELALPNLSMLNDEFIWAKRITLPNGQRELVDQEALCTRLVFSLKLLSRISDQIRVSAQNLAPKSSGKHSNQQNRENRIVSLEELSQQPTELTPKKSNFEVFFALMSSICLSFSTEYRSSNASSDEEEEIDAEDKCELVMDAFGKLVFSSENALDAFFGELIECRNCQKFREVYEFHQEQYADKFGRLAWFRNAEKRAEWEDTVEGLHNFANRRKTAENLILLANLRSLKHLDFEQLEVRPNSKRSALNSQMRLVLTIRSKCLRNERTAILLIAAIDKYKLEFMEFLELLSIRGLITNETFINGLSDIQRIFELYCAMKSGVKGRNKFKC